MRSDIARVGGWDLSGGRLDSSPELGGCGVGAAAVGFGGGGELGVGTRIEPRGLYLYRSNGLRLRSPLKFFRAGAVYGLR